MNNQKRQALDALTGLDRVSNGMLSVHKNELATLRNFVESVDSVDLAGIKKTFLNNLDKIFTCKDDSGGRYASMIKNKIHEMLLDGIPDTLNTSCRCGELQSQIEAERAAHAETRAKLEAMTSGEIVISANCKMYRVENENGDVLMRGNLSACPEIKPLDGLEWKQK